MCRRCTANVALVFGQSPEKGTTQMKKIVAGMTFTAVALVSFSTMAQPDRAQMRQNFETKMVQLRTRVMK